MITEAVTRLEWLGLARTMRVVVMAWLALCPQREVQLALRNQGSTKRCVLCFLCFKLKRTQNWVVAGRTELVGAKLRSALC